MPDACLSAAWLFVEAEFVAHRIHEHGERPHARTDLGTWRERPAAGSLNLRKRLGNGVAHDVDARLLVRRAVALLYPRPAHAAGVIECQLPVTARPHLPAEYPAVELRRRFCSVGRD